MSLNRCGTQKIPITPNFRRGPGKTRKSSSDKSIKEKPSLDTLWLGSWGRLQGLTAFAVRRHAATWVLVSSLTWLISDLGQLLSLSGPLLSIYETKAVGRSLLRPVQIGYSETGYISEASRAPGTHCPSTQIRYSQTLAAMFSFSGECFLELL